MAANAPASGSLWFWILFGRSKMDVELLTPTYIHTYVHTLYTCVVADELEAG